MSSSYSDGDKDRIKFSQNKSKVKKINLKPDAAERAKTEMQI